METILINYTESTTKQREIKLPYYSIGVCSAYKIISQEIAIQVSFGLEKWLSIGMIKSDFAFGATENQCSEKEFNEKYFEVKNKLSEMVGESNKEIVDFFPDHCVCSSVHAMSEDGFCLNCGNPV